MEYVYGALLLNAAGKPIDEKSLTGVLTAAGITADSGRVQALMASLEGVNIAEVLAKAETFTAAPAAAPVASDKKEAKADKKEEEKKEEKGVSEEEAAEGLSALFG
ncbi:Ribosomal protein 60S [mine drainage metagenome]|uniref:Ribosomal protein 60S n=1 Tax=mine drainage metagenome TaxID=410659 RepID=T1D8Y0_9ZZZZ